MGIDHLSSYPLTMRIQTESPKIPQKKQRKKQPGCELPIYENDKQVSVAPTSFESSVDNSKDERNRTPHTPVMSPHLLFEHLINPVCIGKPHRMIYDTDGHAQLICLNHTREQCKTGSQSEVYFRLSNGYGRVAQPLAKPVLGPDNRHSTQTGINEDMTPPTQQLLANEDMTPPTQQLLANEDMTPPTQQLPANEDMTPPTQQLPANEDMTPPTQQLLSNDSAPNRHFVHDRGSIMDKTSIFNDKIKFNVRSSKRGGKFDVSELNSAPEINNQNVKKPDQSAQEHGRQLEETTECEDIFTDASIGGLGLALTHGSVLFECAKHEVHGTTALRVPNRQHPTRIGLVFYQHRHLNHPNHGHHVYEQRQINKLHKDASLENAEHKPTMQQTDSESM